MDAVEFNRLLRRLDDGDESALGIIQNQYGKLIKWIAYGIIKDWHHTSDILNDVLVNLWNKSKKYNDIRSPKALIYDISRKAAISFFRKNLNKHKNEVKIIEVTKKDFAAYLVHEDDYRNLHFAELISELSDIEREIVILKLGCNFTYIEIAEKLRIPDGTIKWKYSEIIRKLRKENNE